MKQLTLGNIINISINLYRVNFKQYLRLAFIANLWSLVPIYGWGRYLAIAGLISRLTFQQLVGNTNKSSQPKLFSVSVLIHFLITGTVVILSSSLFAFIILFLLLFSIVLLVALLFSFFNLKTNFDPTGNSLLMVSIGLSFYLFLFLLSTWFYSRLFITDLVISIEADNKLLTPLVRSYQLTKKMQFKINSLIWISFAITLSVIILSYFVLSILVIIIGIMRDLYFSSLISSNIILSIYILSWLMFFNITTMPFWQSIKAIVYYQARCDREGFDLNLSNF